MTLQKKMFPLLFHIQLLKRNIRDVSYENKRRFVLFITSYGKSLHSSFTGSHTISDICLTQIKSDIPHNKSNRHCGV